MSAVLCLPACLCVSTAACRGQAPSRERQGPLPTRCGCGGCGRVDPSPAPWHALLRAELARCGGDTRAPGGGACCLFVGRPGLGAHPRLTARHWGVQPGPATHWLWVRCGGLGPRCPWHLLPCRSSSFFFARFPGLLHLVAVVAWHLSFCRGCGRRCASLARLVALLCCAAPCPVWSLSLLWLAFLSPWCLLPTRRLSPPSLLGGCAQHVEAGQEPGSLCLPLAPAEAGALGAGPGDGVVPGGSLQLRSWAVCGAVVWRVWTRSLMCLVSRIVRVSTGDSGGAPGLFRVDADTSPFGSEDATPGYRACVPVLAPLSRVRQAGLPGAFWCASPFLWPFCRSSLFGPLWAGVACAFVFFSFCFFPVSLFLFFLFSLFVSSPLFPPSLSCPPCLRLFVLPGPGCPGPWRSSFAPTPP